MARRNEITVVGFMICEDQSVVPMEQLTETQAQRFRTRAAERLRRNMGAYYAQHPEEFEKL